MKTALTLFLACVLSALTAPGCGNAKLQDAASQTASQGGSEAVPAERSEDQNPVGSAKVLETMDAGTYTYVYVDSGGRKTWWAAPQFQVAVGNLVNLPEFGSPMHGFHSKTLNRTFEEIYFAGSLLPVTASDGQELGGAADIGSITMEQAHAGIEMPSGPVEPKLDFSGLSKPESGKTVAEIYAQGSRLAEKEVLLRGKVVKVSSNILNCNWVHVRDGTGADGSNDLTITTQDTVQVGDTVLVRGTLVTDKDFGYGYQFAILVEKATLTVE